MRILCRTYPLCYNESVRDGQILRNNAQALPKNFYVEQTHEPNYYACGFVRKIYSGVEARVRAVVIAGRRKLGGWLLREGVLVVHSSIPRDEVQVSQSVAARYSNGGDRNTGGHQPDKSRPAFIGVVFHLRRVCEGLVRNKHLECKFSRSASRLA